MKKRIWSVLLCAVMMVSVLAGCNAKPAAESGSSDADTSAEGTEPGGIAAEDIKVGFVHVSDASDMGYTYNHDLGTQEMQKALGLSDDQIINKFNVPESSECETALRELVEAGCNIILQPVSVLKIMFWK